MSKKKKKQKVTLFAVGLASLVVGLWFGLFRKRLEDDDDFFFSVAPKARPHCVEIFKNYSHALCDEKIMIKFFCLKIED